jgi:hypothetical protein
VRSASGSFTRGVGVCLTDLLERPAHERAVSRLEGGDVNENFSLVAMIIFIFLSLAFLADQILTFR